MDYNQNNHQNDNYSENNPDNMQNRYDPWTAMYYRATKIATMFFFAALITFLFRTVVFPFIFCAISIIFCYLSKGTKPKLEKYNRLVIIFSTFLLIANTVYSVYMVYTVSHDPEYRAQMNQTYEQFYGMSFDEYMGQMKETYLGTGGNPNE